MIAGVNVDDVDDFTASHETRHAKRGQMHLTYTRNQSPLPELRLCFLAFGCQSPAASPFISFRTKARAVRKSFGR